MEEVIALDGPGSECIVLYGGYETLEELMDGITRSQFKIYNRSPVCLFSC